MGRIPAEEEGEEETEEGGTQAGCGSVRLDSSFFFFIESNIICMKELHVYKPPTLSYCIIRYVAAACETQSYLALRCLMVSLHVWYDRSSFEWKALMYSEAESPVSFSWT